MILLLLLLLLLLLQCSLDSGQGKEKGGDKENALPPSRNAEDSHCP